MCVEISREREIESVEDIAPQSEAADDHAVASLCDRDAHAVALDEVPDWDALDLGLSSAA